MSRLLARLHLLSVFALVACSTRETGHGEVVPTRLSAPPEQRASLVTVELSIVDAAQREQLATRLGPEHPLASSLRDGSLLAVHHRISDGWHIYWRNPGESGLRTRIDVEAEGANAGEVLFPAPERFESAGQVTYGWGHEAVLFVPLTDIDAEATLTLTSNYLACAESCIPGEATLAVRIADLPKRGDEIVTSMLARVPEPAGTRVSAGWIDGALQLHPSAAGLQLHECFPYLHDSALLGHQQVADDGTLELHYRFTGPPPQAAPQGVLRVDIDGEPRYLELAVPWPRS